MTVQAEVHGDRDADSDEESFIYNGGDNMMNAGGPYKDDSGVPEFYEEEEELANDTDEDEVFVYSGHGIDEDNDEESTIEGELDKDTDDSGFVYTGRDADPHVAAYGDDVDEAPVQTENDMSYSTLQKHSTTSVDGPSNSNDSPQDETSVPDIGSVFLHPSISRLRSFIPPELPTSSSSQQTLQSRVDDVMTPTFIQRTKSRSSSMSNINGVGASNYTESDEDSLRWTTLRHLDDYLVSKKGDKARVASAASTLDFYTVLATKGLICVGTDVGRVIVFDVKQQFKCICGDENIARQLGAVTALAVSHDHTHVAVGHITGHVQIFDISRPRVAARHVIPTSWASVASGRPEGHLLGSRITQIGFVAARHTAFISTDEHGLAFYHSLHKVVFVEDRQVRRILGDYPDEEPLPSVPKASQNQLTPGQAHRRRHRTMDTILAMEPLPLGASPHPLDAYQLVALITPQDLRIIGLQSTSKTWYEISRPSDRSVTSKWRGCLAWAPGSMSPKSRRSNHTRLVLQKSGSSSEAESISVPASLAYTWDRSLTILRFSETRTMQEIYKPRSQKPERFETGKVDVEECASLTLESDILAIQWSKTNQIFAFTTSTLELYDVRELKLIERVPFNTLSLVSPSIHLSDTEANVTDNLLSDIAQRVGVYGGKILALGYKELRIGTLLTWADRIHLYVQKGDFPSAIDLAHAYYIGEAEAGTDNLDSSTMRTVIGDKLNDLLEVSVQYAFSEGNLTSGGYAAQGKRSVNQTSLLQDLVGSSTRVCITLDKLPFLFEQVFPRYDVSGLSNMFLERIEPFILDGMIHTIPLNISKRIIAKHRKDGQFEELERFILHVPTRSLESTSAIAICQEFNLYDGLIYLYTAGSGNYVSPFVELLKLVKAVQHQRETTKSFDFSMANSMVFNAYKIYSYLGAVFLGLAYPSQKPLPYSDAERAQTDVYTFLFKNQSNIWSVEATDARRNHTNATLLLQFDAETFLHTLDVAFEHGYLNDDTLNVTRQTICDALVDIIDSPDSQLSLSDVTFINIFLARNLPKYPQFIQLKPTTLQDILFELVHASDPSTLEDRQLAAEFLLSVHKVPDDENGALADVFDSYGFSRLAESRRSQHRQS